MKNGTWKKKGISKEWSEYERKELEWNVTWKERMKLGKIGTKNESI